MWQNVKLCVKLQHPHAIMHSASILQLLVLYYRFKARPSLLFHPVSAQSCTDCVNLPSCPPMLRYIVSLCPAPGRLPSHLASRYLVTTLEPGARLAFTKGFTCRRTEKRGRSSCMTMWDGEGRGEMSARILWRLQLQ